MTEHNYDVIKHIEIYQRDDGLPDILDFISQNRGLELCTVEKEYDLESSVVLLKCAVASILHERFQMAQHSMKGTSNGVFVLQYQNNPEAGQPPARQEKALVRITTDNHKSRHNTISRDEFKITITGTPLVVYALLEELDKKYIKQRLPRIRWYYQSNQGLDSKKIVMDMPKEVLPEFYPWTPNPITVLEDFFRSDCQLLFLQGPPGTGKTSLLRWFIYKNCLRTAVSYDAETLKYDGMIVDFIHETPDDLLIVEDADSLLTSDRTKFEACMVLSKILNASDGLIKLPRKKLIFTTNIGNLNNVDEALLRPGRCYGVLEFRPLTYSQSVAVAKVSKLPLPTVEREYTLAELFNSAGLTPGKIGMGFGVGVP